MARKRKRRLSPEAERKRFLSNVAKGFHKLVAQSRTLPALLDSEHTRFARRIVTDAQLAEHVGDKHFVHTHRGHWWSVRSALNGCRKSDWREDMESFARIGQGKRPRLRSSSDQLRSVERLLHEALQRQHERNFERLCTHLAWLCKELLPRALNQPQQSYLLNRKRDDLCWHIQILHEVVPVSRADLSESARRRIREDRRDFIRITRAVLKNADLWASLLALYFLYPKAVRATRYEKTKRQPLFHALNDLCLHWQAYHFEKFNRALNVLVWQFDEVKHLCDEKLAGEVFQRAGLDFNLWCERCSIDPASVVRRLNRAMAKLRLRDRRTQ